ncbi:hypothetical protein Tco_0359358 [Tanacetum coccineum]
MSTSIIRRNEKTVYRNVGGAEGTNDVAFFSSTTSTTAARRQAGIGLEPLFSSLLIEIERMKKGFLNRREHYAYNHKDANIFNYNNHEEEEEEADDAFGYNLHDLMNDPRRNDPRSHDPRGHNPMMMLSRYTDLADFNFFNRFHDDFDDQDFL